MSILTHLFTIKPLLLKVCCGFRKICIPVFEVCGLGYNLSLAEYLWPSSIFVSDREELPLVLSDSFLKSRLSWKVGSVSHSQQEKKKSALVAFFFFFPSSSAF